MKFDGRIRAVISNVEPLVEEGRFAIKRIIEDGVIVSADIFAEGNLLVAADLLFRSSEQKRWQKVIMRETENDRWRGAFFVRTLGLYTYKIEAWVDYFRTWQRDLSKKAEAKQNIKNEMQVGIDFLDEIIRHKKHRQITHILSQIKKAKNAEEQALLAASESLWLLVRDCYPNKRWVTKMEKELSVIVDPPKARFSTWYEMFPRSASPEPDKHGTFKDCQDLLPHIAEMGFDVLYFPPIHPIGYTKRKGKKNLLKAADDDYGSPWAIGSNEGGHQSIHPLLGTMEDFEQLIASAKKHNIDIALDLAFQCSLDHPYIKEHPDWFCWRPDGTIQYAENPPKKYEDIVPFYFDTESWKSLWIELRDIILFWIEKGVKIFRVDNPHTKPFVFWEWLIFTVKQQYPDVILLSEAFTRPKVMLWLSKLGFTQSYTYFTWRHTKKELTDYFTEIILSEIREYFRPNLWVNTPDILSEELQGGAKPFFISRLILAATLSSNYGMYAPAFELMERETIPGTEEYLDSEKYQLRHWDRDAPESLKNLITKINAIRKREPALQYLSNLMFLQIDNPHILYYSKFYYDTVVLILVSLNPAQAQTGTLKVPLKELDLSPKEAYEVYDLVLDQTFVWEGEYQHITLDLQNPASLLRIHKRIKREIDFGHFQGFYG